MKNDGGLVGIWLLSGNEGACAQFLCLPYGISRPALLFLPFFSPCAASSTGRRWRWGYPFLTKKILAVSWWMVLKWALWFSLLRNDWEFSYSVRKEVWFLAPTPLGNVSSSLPSPHFYVYACFQINHILFLICFLVWSSIFLIARLTVLSQ